MLLPQIIYFSDVKQHNDSTPYVFGYYVWQLALFVKANE